MDEVWRREEAEARCNHCSMYCKSQIDLAESVNVLHSIIVPSTALIVFPCEEVPGAVSLIRKISIGSVHVQEQ
eukprot:8723543-Ditylum_brightwellii.AAC.1